MSLMPATRRTERGAVLLMVVVLSAVVLTVMTALIYMVTSGTQVSGLQKRYKTALEAARGGTDIVYQMVGLRGAPADVASFTTAMDTVGLTSSIPLMTSTCTGTVGATTYTGMAAKLMAPTSSWTNCNTSLSIDPGDPSTYDMVFHIGASVKYNFYAKVVQTVAGNSGGDTGLNSDSVVTTGSGEITVSPKPYLYAVEMLAVNPAKNAERAKLTVLYQY